MSSAKDITKLRAAIRSGQSRVSYGDRTVEYRSLDEMRQILGEMEREEGTAKSTRIRTTPVYDSGL